MDKAERDLLIKISKECKRRNSWESCGECPYIDPYDDDECLLCAPPQSWESILEGHECLQTIGDTNNET